MSTTVKMTRSAKRILEEIQARLRLDTGENIEQYIILEKILLYVKEHYIGFLTRQLNENEVEKYKSLITDYEIIDE